MTGMDRQGNIMQLAVTTNGTNVNQFEMEACSGQDNIFRVIITYMSRKTVKAGLNCSSQS